MSFLDDFQASKLRLSVLILISIDLSSVLYLKEI
uniref:Uncharacterized protein n=1 Tax=Rhizophora mucronata TaxID=61149 RepID=A0A2P2JQF2_RHIMU